MLVEIETVETLTTNATLKGVIHIPAIEIAGGVTIGVIPAVNNSIYKTSFHRRRTIRLNIVGNTVYLRRRILNHRTGMNTHITCRLIPLNIHSREAVCVIRPSGKPTYCKCELNTCGIVGLIGARIGRFHIIALAVYLHTNILRCKPLRIRICHRIDKLCSCIARLGVNRAIG